MRGAIAIKMHGREYQLLPTFGVVSNFEDRHGSIASHYAALVSLTATTQARAFLVLQALQAYRQEHPPEVQALDFSQDAVARALFESGLWSDEAVGIEVELVESLLYTPEQHQGKKAGRAAAKAAQGEILASLATLSSYSDSLPPT